MVPEEELQESEQPLFSLVKGSASEEEIAALTIAVLQTQRPQTATKSRQSAKPLTEVGRLLSRRQRIGAGLPPGPGSWRRAKPR
ncbi:acyl-CoA carboxylase subunit epsilon [Rothia uropygialis]|uniref:acyl-CoA carboxylase subunit epsilon n=1 Tax=Kocuria sp. 36 TaxID=1415402 RepID=UPI00101DB2B5|nr:acyl-CoA carboxylase subunit epsilon [Kocuria sp. 36]